MKIVVLDGGTLNPGDLTWEGLEALGDTEIYDRTPEDQVLERSKDAEVLLVNKVVLSREIMDQLPSLRFICVLATGYNVVDTDAAREKGIAVSNIPTYGTQSVAQMVFAHLLNLTQRVAYHSDTVKAGRWAQSEDFCYWDYPLIELHGLTMGVFGFGRIGRNTADIAKAFGMKVIAFDPFLSPERAIAIGVEKVELEDIFKRSDFITLHTPLTEKTRHVIDAAALAKCKKGVRIINCARGGLGLRDPFGFPRGSVSREDKNFRGGQL